MRRLKQDDDGITIVFVTIGMAALLLIAALGLDIGGMFLNKARAQNSADSRALAAAINCAQGQPIDTAIPALRTDQKVVAPDGLDISSCAGQSQVTATVAWTQNFQFIPKASVDGHGKATAKWGPVGGSNVLPITIASCEWSLARLNGNTDITLYLDDPKVDSGCNSLPGGFSQLQRGTDGKCSIALTAASAGTYTVPGQPGGDLKKEIPCVTPLPHDVLIPIYDVTVLSKANHDNGQGPYTILGFAEFNVTGYSFNGQANAESLIDGCPVRPDDPNAVDPKTGHPLADPKYCIRGDFIRMLAPGDAISGPGQDFGVTKVSLIK